MSDTLNHFSHALVVPTSLRKSVLLAAHDGLGHGGVNATRSLINKHFTWPNLKDDVRKYVQSCQVCQKCNKSGGTRVPLCEPELIVERFEKLAIDIVGPLPKSKRHFRYILTCMDMATSFPFAVPLRTYTSEDTAEALLSIISVIGSPLAILSDQGSNFLSITLSHLYKKLGVVRIKTSPYRPQSNGKLERFHSTLKCMLRKVLDAGQEWPGALDLVLHFARNIPHSRHGYTPYELTFMKPTPFILSTLKSLWLGESGNSVNVPQFIEDLDKQLAAQSHVVKHALKSKVSEDRLSKESDIIGGFHVGDVVLKRSPGLNKCLDSSWEGPYIITELLPPVNCKLVPQGSKSKPRVIHLSQVKKAELVSVYTVVLVSEDVPDAESPLQSQHVAMQLDEQQHLSLASTLDRFPMVFSDVPGKTSAAKHTINLLSSTPLWTPSYVVPLAYQAAFRKELESLIELDIIEPSTSAWSSPPIPVKKKDGGIRIVVDFRKLNSVTVPEPFFMPTIDSILAQIGSASCLSKIDLLKGFHQVPMDEMSKHLTAFSCWQGKFQYKRMPFGLRNAPATFQLLMQKVLAGLESFSLSYIDDIIIFSLTFHDHLSHISSVLSRLTSYGLTVKKSKCCWFFKSFEFLGFVVGNGQLSIPESRIQHMKSYKRPLTISQLRSFLGLCNFYSRFIPTFSSFTSVLSKLTRKHCPNKLRWNNDEQIAFESIIHSICDHAKLIIPDTYDVRCVFIDASSKGVGGVLCVSRSDVWKPCAFYSRQLVDRESKYSATELEALALLSTVEHFKFYLCGVSFKVFTDHQALKSIFEGVPPNNRLHRWKDKLSLFDMDIIYIKGKTNVIADALSRQGWPQQQATPDTSVSEEGGDVV